ncbi:4-hydroxy-tetrahydrodipicolinate reductase [Lysobacter ciconiae]|uniref:4-hydroxy-tetrahydrodipicolinate reductase n=1 Tax=Novilysobacter ciconiae TaxID=2781022 RepID=A0A7S6ZRC6_9GAMM|nr:4-hydroxy-tetrahydrodipicolinate reductase [Lysobacter ciconiae]QOW18587.1 4-hydroxy-tetrahydrodipicolinate reductase [Lysobacter ciconiae]
MKQSSDVTRVLIHGASGRMGQALLRLLATREDLRAVAAVSRSKPAQRVVDGLPYFAVTELHGVPAFDVAIDFSLPDGLEAILGLCVERGVPLVSGTTGLSASGERALDAAATTVPVLLAANFSLGVTVLGDLVERAARLLQTWDCDIVESHHKHKLDAPSGTALALGARAEQGGAQPSYASLRAGDIVGEHTVQFAGPGERIELVHRATSRDVFARGALHAAAWLAGQAPGRYQLRDMLR